MNEKGMIPFDYEGKSVRVIQDDDGNPWWVAKDVCDVLEHSNSRMAISELDDDERRVRKVYTSAGPRQMAVVNESGLYMLIFRSNKPQAKPFRKWVTSEVLPSIRKTGRYQIEPEQPAQYTDGDLFPDFGDMVGDAEIANNLWQRSKFCKAGRRAKVTAHLRSELREDVIAVAEKIGVSFSAFVEQAVYYFLKHVIKKEGAQPQDCAPDDMVVISRDRLIRLLTAASD